MGHKKMLKLSVVLAILYYIIIAVSNVSFAGTLSSDINGINESKYPGIKSVIQDLQKKYSNYKFQVYYTGIDWTEAVTMEYQGHGSSPKNLFSVSQKYKGKWYCPICGSKTYDTGWYCASIDAIKYMMDPRNSLNEDDLFQFKNLEISDVSAENIQATISKRYSSYAYLNNPTTINAIINASQKCNLNGYSILAKIFNEQGRGTSPFATGSGYNGQYIGYYNFFNVGACGNGESTVILNGLKYAKNKGWNSVESSILGGSEYYKSSYIGKGQNTLYYQRFNVVYEVSLFSHQYQQDIMGAQTSGTLLKNYYSDSSAISNAEHNFIIPLYENMPREACSRPSTTENSELKYEDATVLVNKATVKASPNSSRIISYLNINEKVKVLERAENKSSDGKYWDIIVTEIDGTYGYIERSQISQENMLPDYVFDYKYYADNNTDVKAVFGYDEESLKNHFINSGIIEGRKSSPTFDLRYYVEANTDVKAAFGNNYSAAFNHFILGGYKEYRRSSSEYDGTFYKYFYDDLNNYSSEELMEHYLSTGRNAGRLASIDMEIEKVIFNSDVYANCNEDIKNAVGLNQEALRIHWIRYGIKTGRMASFAYDPQKYYLYNVDLKNAYGQNYEALLKHFINSGINEARTTSIVFDVATYLSKNTDIKNAYGKNYKLAYIHFVYSGVGEGRPSSPVFEVKTYFSLNTDIKNAYGNNYFYGFVHFVNAGYKEYRRSSTEYDPTFYRYYYNDLNSYSSEKLIEHYLLIGKSGGRLAGLDSEIEKVVFNSDVYLNCNTDIRNAIGSDETALRIHWIKYGIKTGRLASFAYDPQMYWLLNEDLQKSFGNNYEAIFNHFIKGGINEARMTSIVFDMSTYLSKNGDIKNAYGNNYKLAYVHFVEAGVYEGRAASVVFDARDYIASNIDVRNAYGNNYFYGFVHFINSGIYEKRKTSPTFDMNYYSSYGDLKSAYGTRYNEYYVHYVRFGYPEGRRAI